MVRRRCEPALRARCRGRPSDADRRDRSRRLLLCSWRAWAKDPIHRGSGMARPRGNDRWRANRPSGGRRSACASRRMAVKNISAVLESGAIVLLWNPYHLRGSPSLGGSGVGRQDSEDLVDGCKPRWPGLARPSISLARQRIADRHRSRMRTWPRTYPRLEGCAVDGNNIGARPGLRRRLCPRDPATEIGALGDRPGYRNR
jgi:hypothetical protein